MTGRRNHANALNDGSVTIELSSAQVDQVISAATDSSGVRSVLFGLNGAPSSIDVDFSSLRDKRLSRSLLAGLLVLAAFPVDGSFIGNKEIAEQLGMTMTTAHRYVSTLLAVGLIERDPSSRRYRRGS